MSVLTHVISGPSKLWCSYKIGLDVLNAQLNRRDEHDENPGAPKDPKLDELLAESGNARATWERLFEAERRLIPMMSDEMIEADALRKFARGRDAGLPETQSLQTAFENSKSSAHRRALHEQMVDSLQVHHFRRGLERDAQRRTATRLNVIGLVMLLPTVVVIVFLVYYSQIAKLAHYHILLVMWFGLLGAFLSRMIAFQGAVNKIPYDSLVSEFSVWSVIVRLIVGAMGALIVYMMITGKLVGGDLFPDMTLANFFEQIEVNKKSRGVALGPGGQPVNPLRGTAGGSADMFSAEFAKLLVWATIAGFSERLLPDRLNNLEALTQGTPKSS